MKKLMVSVLAALSWCSVRADLPEGLTPVEYVESTTAGKQYADTRYTPMTRTCGMCADLQLTAKFTDDKLLFGAINPNRCAGTDKGVWGYAWKESGTGGSGNLGSLDTDRHVLALNFYDSGVFIIDDDPVRSTTLPDVTTSTDRSPYVGAGHNGNSAYGAYPMRIYSFKITSDATTLEADLRPVADANGVACLYDLVRGITNYSRTATPFVAGPAVIRSDMLEIATTLLNDPGTSPACGRMTGLSAGDTVECSAPKSRCDPYGNETTCTGYRLYDCTLDLATWKPAFTEVSGSPFAGNSFTYTHGRSMQRIVWQYSRTYRGTNVYEGVSGGSWNEPSNWTKGAVPDATDHVVVEGKSVVFAPADASSTVRSLTLKKGARLEVQAPPAANPKNFATVYPSAYRFNVTETFVIEPGATFRPVVDRLTGNPVFVNCANFVLKDGGSVDATIAGYDWVSKSGVDLADLTAKGHQYVTGSDAYSYCIGTGTDNPSTPGYAVAGTRGVTYGYPYAPWLAGAQSSIYDANTTDKADRISRGGGAVVIFASGQLKVAGDIWAEGGTRFSGGSTGGGIWLVGNAFDFYSTARLNANGRGAISWINKRGTGGRISLGAGLTADHVSNLVTGQVPAQVSLACGDDLDFLNAHTYQGFLRTASVVIDLNRTEAGTRTYTVNTNVETLVAVKGVGVLGASKIGGLVSVDPTGEVSLGVERLKGEADARSHYSASGWRLLRGSTEIASGTGSTATWTPSATNALVTLEWTIDSITQDPESDFFADVPAGANAAKTFTGADGGNWEDAGNWSPAGVPGLSDTVTLAGKTVYATNTIGAKSLVVAADAKLVVGGAGDAVLAETAAIGPKFGLKVAGDCSISGQVAVGGKDLTVPARLEVGGDLTLEGAAVLAVYATRASKYDFATLYAEATPVTVGGKLTLNGTSQVVPDSDYLTGAPVHFTAGTVEIAGEARFNAVARGWGWKVRDGLDYGVEIRGWGCTSGNDTFETYAPGSPGPANDNNAFCGAGHGGLADGAGIYAGRAYGYEYAPFLPGSCGYASTSRGGGAIWIDCSGQFTLNGALDASGTSATTSTERNSTGGGICVSAAGFAAGPQAQLLASGGTSPGSSYGAAGGRIALLLATTAAERAALAHGETPTGLTYTSGIAGVPTVTVTGGAGSSSLAEDGTVATVRGTATQPTVHVTGDPVAAVSTGVVYGDVVTALGATANLTASEYGTDPNASYIRYSCLGYLATNATGEVIAQGEGRSASFTVADNDTYFTWRWGNRQTGMDVKLPANCGGTVSYGGTAYAASFQIWANDGTEIEATASSGYEFLYWIGDVPAGCERQARLALPGGTYRSVRPVFRPASAATTRTWLGGTGDWIDPAMWEGGVIPGLGDDVVIGEGVCHVSNYVACANLTVNGTAKLLMGCTLASGKTTVVPTYPTMNAVSYGGTIAFERLAMALTGTLTVGGTAEVAVGADDQSAPPQIAARDVSLAGSGVLYLTAASRTTTATYDAGYDTGRGFLTVVNNLAIGDTAQLYLRSDSYSGGSMVCVVSNQFTLAAGATVNANDGGFWVNMAKDPQSLQPVQSRSGGAYTGAGHGGTAYGGSKNDLYDVLYAPRMPGATSVPPYSNNRENCRPAGGVIRIHARRVAIAGTMKATSETSNEYFGSSGGAIWVTSENDLKLASGAVLSVIGGTYAGARWGGGGRIALARYLKPEELAALTADGATLPERFAKHPDRNVYDYAAFTNRFSDVTVDIRGGTSAWDGTGTFRFLDGKGSGLTVVIR